MNLINFTTKKLVAYFSKIFEPQSVELEKLSAAEESKKPTHTNFHANVMIFSTNFCKFIAAILFFGKTIFKFGISDRSNFRGSITLRGSPYPELSKNRFFFCFNRWNYYQRILSQNFTVFLETTFFKIACAIKKEPLKLLL